jgi:hypothetical protein
MEARRRQYSVELAKRRATQPARRVQGWGSGWADERQPVAVRIADRVWSIEDIIGLLEMAEKEPAA